MTATCSARGTGWYLSCLSSSVRRAPRSSWLRVCVSRSEANCAKAASSRYWARSSRSWPATWRMAFVCASPPTRETLMPTLSAGRWPAMNCRDLTICPRLLAQVVVAAERVLALIHEVLAHRAPGIRGDEVERGGLGCRGGDDDGVPHRAVLLESRCDACDRRGVLTDGDVDADQVLALLIDDRVEEDRGLACEPVADDQLALAAPERDHRVDGLDPGLDGAVDALTRDDSRGDLLERHRLRGLDRTLAVDRHAQRVDHAADQLLADRNLEQPPSRAHLVALVQVPELTQDYSANLVLLEVEGQPICLSWKLEQLTCHRVLQPVDLGDAVARGDDAAHVGRHQAGVEVLETSLDDLGDLFGADAHFCLAPPRTRPPGGGAAAAIGWRGWRRPGGRRTGA